MVRIPYNGNFPLYFTMMYKTPKIYVALPVLNEVENLPQLIKCLNSQTIQDFELIVCINQYESWWDIADKNIICQNNQESINYLKELYDKRITIIDRSSKGNGWPEKKGGVGWARKIAMDFINLQANPEDLIVSIDADTDYPSNYLEEIINSFRYNPKITSIAIPYYHKLSGNETDELILRYEIYMRNYLLNMLKIQNPYAFTALGSAIALPVWAYRKIGGITPVKSGEDFYFLQKLVKTARIGIWLNTLAYPSSRFSDRVLFGTGPALIKGSGGDWDSYPIYAKSLFSKIKETYDSFNDLFEKDIETPMDDFLKNQFNTDDLWGALRNNYTDKENFIRACKVKVDGLRILQFLKKENQEFKKWDEFALNEDEKLRDYLQGKLLKMKDLIALRESLFDEEMQLRKHYLFTGL